jgi:hypothetical protein
MTQELYESDIPGLKLAFRGKVRDVYDLGDALLIVTTDRLSAFDPVALSTARWTAPVRDPPSFPPRSNFDVSASWPVA